MAGLHVTAEEMVAAAADDATVIEGIESGVEKYAYPRREAVNSKLNISVMEGSKRTAATAATIAAVAESYRPRYYAFDILSRHTKQLEMVYNRTAKLNNSVADRPASSRQYGETLNLAISQLERKIARTLIQLGKQQEKVLVSAITIFTDLRTPNPKQNKTKRNMDRPPLHVASYITMLQLPHLCLPSTLWH